MLEFTRKAALVLALICLALAAWTLRDVLMTLFGAFILANGMSLAARTLAHKTGLRYALAAGTVIMACTATLGAAFWFFGATLIEQVDELRQRSRAALNGSAGRSRRAPTCETLCQTWTSQTCLAQRAGSRGLWRPR